MKRYIGLLSALALILTGCSKAAERTDAPKINTISVNVHGVNYTAEPFRYVLVDPTNPSNRVGGEHIGPYIGGGITCCFTLPKRWRPDIRISVYSTHWLPKSTNGDLPEVEKIHSIEVPAYPNGGAAELWVLRTADGTIELVASNVEPDHPQWPGKVKGWPEPSLAYQRERWELYKKLAEYDVKVFQHSLDELQTRKQAHLQAAWDLDTQYERDLTKKFSGPNDPAYAARQKKSYVEGLRTSEENLKQLLKEKP